MLNTANFTKAEIRHTENGNLFRIRVSSALGVHVSNPMPRDAALEIFRGMIECGCNVRRRITLLSPRGEVRQTRVV